jgi:hypothetical protein
MIECKEIAKTAAAGVFEISTDGGKTWQVEPNIVVTEGLNYLLASALDGAAQKLTFYVALFGGNVTPQATWTGANWVANATEFTNYTESGRQLWQKGDVAAGALGNSATPAVFTVGTGGGVVRGAALVEAAAKSSTTGVLIAAARFASDKTLDETEELRVRYTISLTAA